MEESMMDGPVTPIPVYFAPWNPELQVTKRNEIIKLKKIEFKI